MQLVVDLMLPSAARLASYTNNRECALGGLRQTRWVQGCDHQPL